MRQISYKTWASIHSADGRLAARSREVSKPRDLNLNFSNRSEIWQPPWKCRCWDACHISERYDHLDTKRCGFDTSRDLAVHLVNTCPVCSPTLPSLPRYVCNGMALHDRGFVWWWGKCSYGISLICLIQCAPDLSRPIFLQITYERHS